MNPPVKCGVGPASRGHALGFRFVSEGSKAKILDVSAYMIYNVDKKIQKNI